MLLNPSCSVMVCRLPIQKSKNGRFKWEKTEISTDSYPNGSIDDMLYSMKSLMKTINNINEVPDIDYIENSGGGAHSEYIEMSWKIAKLFAVGEMNEDKAREMDKLVWEEGDEKELLPTCKNCLDIDPNIKCEEYVRRVVDKCEGRFKKTIYDEVTEKLLKYTKKE